MNAPLAGAALAIAYTGLIAAADGVTKQVAASFAAPQLFAISGLAVAGLSLLAARKAGPAAALATSFPRMMALRSALTVLAALAFFQGFRLLPFAEMFLFIGMMPLLAALLSGPVLGERVRLAAWIALGSGFWGMTFVFPGGLDGFTPGHGWAALGAASGTLSMLLARRIGQSESNALAQVFYPNLALGAITGLALPFVWRPMGLSDLGLILTYAVLLFAARWVLVVSLRLLAAHAVTPLMNLQFLWMVGVGWLVFGELPTTGTWTGAAIMVTSGLYLVWDQIAPWRICAPTRRCPDP